MSLRIASNGISCVCVCAERLKAATRVSLCTCAFLDIGGARWFLDVEVPYANKHIHQFFFTHV